MPPSVVVDLPADPVAPADPLPVEAPLSEDGRPVSEAVYWRDYYHLDEIRYEWSNGRLEEVPVSDIETMLVHGWLQRLLSLYLESHPIAQLIPPDVGFRLVLPTKVQIRRPDLAVVRHDNPARVDLRATSFSGIYDLCIKALSDLKPAAIHRDTVTKKAEYAGGGVSEYYILHNDPKHWAFYRRTPAGNYAPIPPIGGVIASTVLSGFRFRLDDLVSRPGLAALSTDPVYADFVLPEWQRDRARAEAEVQRANAEARRADLQTQARRDAEARERALLQRLAVLEAQLNGSDGGDA